VHLSAKTCLRQAQSIDLPARTHLFENGQGTIVSNDLRDEHRNVAIRCFDYICNKLGSSLEARELSPSRLDQSVDRLRTEKGEITYLDYPLLFWMDHAKDASDDIADHFHLDAEFFKPHSLERSVWFGAYSSKTHTEHET